MLALAELDGKLGQLRHRLRSLPEIARIADLQANRGGVDDRCRDARIVVDDLTRDQKKSEQDVEQVRTRRERDRSRMDQGLITNPKDLERMTHELVSLERRIGDLEDVELEIMARLEDAQRDLDQSTAELGEIDAELEAAGINRDRNAEEIRAEIATVEAERGVVAGDVPADLLALYEKVREKQGSGAALLRARRCEGCQINLDAAAYAVIAKAASDDVVRCEECTRVLVRTGDSGL